jgi:arginine:ornithine antiporter/lysine permease
MIPTPLSSREGHMDANGKSPSKRGVKLFGLVGLVVSSCIGSGVFASAGQLANVAAPGPALASFAFVIAGFLLVTLSLSNLAVKRPRDGGVVLYAKAGFGPFHGFISGWGYWLSCWLGNVGFAVMIAQVLGNVWPEAFTTESGGINALAVVIVTIVIWFLVYLVIRGVESAAFLNAIVMVVKIASIVLFICFCIATFDIALFADDFMGTLSRNVVIAAAHGGEGLGGFVSQFAGCFLILMWLYCGMEGASSMISRAERRSDVGKATVLGVTLLSVMYVLAAILPYGVMEYSELVSAPSPAAISIFEYMAPGWGGAFVSVAIVVSILGSWLSFTMIPAETSSVMAGAGILPAKWDEKNVHGAPQFALVIVGLATTAFFVLAVLSADAYTFAISMTTVSSVLTWGYASAYQVKVASEEHEAGQMVIGVCALAFLVTCMILNGWQFLLLAFLAYIPGFFVYARARRDAGEEMSRAEKIGAAVIMLLGLLSIPLTAIGYIPVF